MPRLKNITSSSISLQMFKTTAPAVNGVDQNQILHLKPFEDVDETLWLVDNTNDASYNANIIDSYIARAILTRIKDRGIPAEHPNPEV